MKDISETTKSKIINSMPFELKEKARQDPYVHSCLGICVNYIQAHTIDKAVLREIMTRDRHTIFKGTEGSDDVNSQVLEDIWKLLEKEE